MAQNPVPVKQDNTAMGGWLAPWAEMDRLFDRFGFGMPALRRFMDMAPNTHAAMTMPSPAIDITEDDKAFHLTAELPGLEEKDVDVSLSGDTLTVSGEKKLESERKEKNYTLSERSYGSFRRSFWLPDGVDRDKVEASFAKGVLTVVLPKAAAAAPAAKKIEVKAAA